MDKCLPVFFNLTGNTHVNLKYDGLNNRLNQLVVYLSKRIEAFLYYGLSAVVVIVIVILIRSINIAA